MSGNKKWLLLGVISVVVLLGSLFFLFKDQLVGLNLVEIAGFVREWGPWAVLIGGGLIVMQTFFPVVPFLVIAGANVLVFGLWGGFLLNWVSAVFASIVMFFLARTTGRHWAKRKIEKYAKVNRLNGYLEQNGLKTVLSLRLFPIIPPVFVNLTAGVSGIKARDYILGTAVGKIPAIFVESIIGNDLFSFSDNKLRLILLVAVFGVVLVIGMKFLRKKLKLS